jgi:hypothetical protein
MFNQHDLMVKRFRTAKSTVLGPARWLSTSKTYRRVVLWISAREGLHMRHDMERSPR